MAKARRPGPVVEGTPTALDVTLAELVEAVASVTADVAEQAMVVAHVLGTRSAKWETTRAALERIEPAPREGGTPEVRPQWRRVLQ